MELDIDNIRAAIADAFVQGMSFAKSFPNASSAGTQWNVADTANKLIQRLVDEALPTENRNGSK